MSEADISAPREASSHLLGVIASACALCEQSVKENKPEHGKEKRLGAGKHRKRGKK
jgi:hypothetical protein